MYLLEDECHHAITNQSFKLVATHYRREFQVLINRGLPSVHAMLGAIAPYRVLVVLKGCDVEFVML